MKKFLVFLLCLTMCCTFFCSCGNKGFNDNGKINIVTTCFPAYDFARELCKDNANIILLLKPGQESHDFEPTPADIINIQKSDLFICVGGENEKWVESLIENEKSLNVLKMLDVVEGHSDSHEHDHTHDEHVWTSPVNAIKIVEAINASLCAISEENSEVFNKNLEEYKVKLNELDCKFKEITNQSDSKLIVFADRFPVRHFTDEYSLEVVSVFSGCSSQSEPSAAAVATVIETVKEKSVKAVFYTEFSNQKTADTVCSETGCKKLLFHSCHNLTKEEFNSGETYYSLMLKNAENLKTAICN